MPDSGEPGSSSCNPTSSFQRAGREADDAAPGDDGNGGGKASAYSYLKPGTKLLEGVALPEDPTEGESGEEALRDRENILRPMSALSSSTGQLTLDGWLDTGKAHLALFFYEACVPQPDRQRFARRLA